MAAKTINVAQEEGYWSGIREAAAVLNDGGVVVFPTETVYGVAARADRSDALQRLREAKNRSSDRPFTIHIPRRSDAERYVPDLGSYARRFIRKGWPGPLTLIMRTETPEATPIAADIEPAAVEAIYHDNSVGLRCPDNHVARDLLSETLGPVVAASANPRGHKAPRTAQEASQGLNGVADLVLDGGAARYNKPSTIVRVNDDGYEVVREGVYDDRMLRGLLKLSILFVCTGNTCRSPMAAGLARYAIATRLGCDVGALGDRDIEIDSAGTFARSGGPPSESAVSVLKARGIDISDHGAQPLTVELIQRADHIFAMTASHREAVVRMETSAAERTTTLLVDGEIADPFGDAPEVYAKCADTIEDAIKKRLTEVPL